MMMRYTKSGEKNGEGNTFQILPNDKLARNVARGCRYSKVKFLYHGNTHKLHFCG